MGKFFTVKKTSLVLAFLFFSSIVLLRNAQGALLPDGGGIGSVDQYKESLNEPGINLEQFSLFNLGFTGRALTKGLVGFPSTETESKNQTGSALSTLTMLTGALFLNKPASGVEYLADIGKNLGLVKPVYAQTQETGYEILTPVKELWKQTRNLAYMVFVLIMIAIGFMIMLRTRIDPRTVATVQAAIPGVIVSFILVTFSYAIAGLIVDITNVLTYVFGLVLEQGKIVTGVQNLIVLMRTDPKQNIFQTFLQILNSGKPQEAGQNIIAGIVNGLDFGLTNFIKEIPGAETISGWVIGLFFAMLVVMIMFRVFMMLLTALVTIVLLTIVAPFQFLLAAVPGQGRTVFSWFKSMLVAALTFPVTFVLLLIAAAFLGVDKGAIHAAGGLSGEFKWFPAPLGVFAAVSSDDKTKLVTLFNEIIGIGILLFLPKVNDIIRAALDIKTAPWAGAPSEAIGSGIAAVRKVLPI